MGNIWSDQAKYQTWLDVEIAACEANCKLGKIPKSAMETIRTKASFKPERILEIEEEVRHDVIAFLTNVNEYVGDAGRYIHVGMTSSDVLDTGLALQLKSSVKLLRKELLLLEEAIRDLARQHKKTVMIGRSHAIHGEPITFGFKLAGWLAETLRNKERLNSLEKDISVGQISGAMGTYANTDPEIESITCELLELECDTASTQVISRDRHANYVQILALIGSSLDRFSTEIRNLQRTDVLEVEENFAKGQKGSSAMPHKRNPVLSENLTGISRLIRSYVIPSMENISLWHERDISHSSVERMMAPDANVLTDFSLARMTNIISNLVVYPKNMLSNLNKLNKLPMSEGLMLALTHKGIPREKAYKMIQRNAMKVWKTGEDFSNLLTKDKEVSQHLSKKEINQILDINHSIKKTNQIFKKIFKK